MRSFIGKCAIACLASFALASTTAAQGVMDSLTAVSVGSEHACGIHASGAIYCWGNGRHGQLGNGVAVDSEFAPVRVASKVRFRLVSAGATHSCALSAESELYCWGTDYSGVLGDAAAVSVCSETPCALVPARVAPTMIFDTVSVGYEHSCALRRGVAYCWGRNQEGQLGREWAGENCGGVRCGRTPEPVTTALRFDQLSVRGMHSCALSAGAAYCWGDNAYGQLAAPPSVLGSSTPLRIASPSSLRSLSTSGLYSCALTRGGAVTCWGRLPAHSPSTEKGSAVEPLFRGFKHPRFVAVGAGGTHACALAADGGVYCWGGGLYDRLGAQPRDTCDGLPCAERPVRVPLRIRFSALSVGGTSSCAVSRERVKCWGGRPKVSSEPTLVASP